MTQRPALQFNVQSSVLSGEVRLKLSGTADADVLPALNSAIGAAHLQAAQGHLERVVVDLRALEFMNSSCFKVFVSWLSEVRQLAQPYRVRVLSNPERHWQRRSLAALTAFASGLVEVETSAP